MGTDVSSGPVFLRKKEDWQLLDQGRSSSKKKKKKIPGKATSASERDPLGCGDMGREGPDHQVCSSG